jgi:hypothetical protein
LRKISAKWQFHLALLRPAELLIETVLETRLPECRELGHMGHTDEGSIRFR